MKIPEHGELTGVTISLTRDECEKLVEAVERINRIAVRNNHHATMNRLAGATSDEMVNFIAGAVFLADFAQGNITEA